MLKIRNWVYTDKPPNLKNRKTKPATSGPSMKSVPKKKRLFQVLQFQCPRATLDINGKQKVVFIGGITSARITDKAMSATGKERLKNAHLHEASTSREYYVAEVILNNKIDYDGSKYLFRYYDLSPAKDRQRTAMHNFQHCFKQFWGSQKRTKHCNTRKTVNNYGRRREAWRMRSK